MKTATRQESELRPCYCECNPVACWGAILHRRLALGIALIALTMPEASAADDRAIPVRYQNWTGPYIGGHLGDAWGGSDWTAHETGVGAPPLNGSLDFYQPFDFAKGTGSYLIGLQAGYNYTLPSGVALIDVALPEMRPCRAANRYHARRAESLSLSRTYVDGGSQMGGSHLIRERVVLMSHEIKNVHDGCFVWVVFLQSREENRETIFRSSERQKHLVFCVKLTECAFGGSCA
jgi:hypothetical protein